MKKLFLIFSVLLSMSYLFGQEQIIPEKRIFQDSTGKIFVNKALPLYFKISQEKGQNSEHKLLVSQTTPQFTNPLYLGKEGKNIFYSPWAVDTVTKKTVSPRQNVVFELYADSKPPITKISNNVTAYEKKDSLFFGGDLKIWFSANDELSGLEQIYISINNEKFNEYLYDTLMFEHGNTYQIKYYSTDLVGNAENIQDVIFTIDTTRPLTNLVILGNHVDNIVAGNCSVSLKPQDAFSGYAKTYYYIDNQAKKIYTAPIAVGNLREGRHILKYYTEDNVQNKEKEKSFEFFVDRTPPMIIEEIVGDYVYINGKGYTSGRSQLQLTALDNRAGVKEIYYSLDKKEWILYEKPVDLPKDVKNVNIYYYAVDNVGNKTDFDQNSLNMNKYFATEMDLEEPSLSKYFSGPQLNVFDTVCISSNTKILIKATDNQSGTNNISYQIDGGNTEEFKSDFTISESGYHTITAYAFDNVNNVGSINFTVKVDTTGPEIFTHFSTNSIKTDGKITYPLNTKIFIGATDNATGIDKITYNLNSVTPQTYQSFINMTIKGDYELEITAFDRLGNKTVEKFSFRIK